MGQEQGKVMIAYGQVERNAADHWWIELENVVSGPERQRELPTDGERPRHFD